jgi:hypothetical protein
MTSWQIQAAKDPNTSPEILSSLFDNPECHDFLIKNPSSSRGLLAALGVKEAFTSDPMNRRISVANVLREAPTAEIIERILVWTEGSLNVLQEGEREESVSLTKALKHYFYPSAASNPNTPVKYLEEFSRSDYKVTLSNLCPNPSLPLNIVNQFAEKLIAATTDEEINTYDRIVSNPKLSRKYLTIFSKHPKFYVRAGVARNPNTPDEVQIELASDLDSGVFFGLQFNPNLCEEALLMMCQRTKQDVRKSTQWVNEYYNNLKNKALAGHYSKSIKELVLSANWPT